MGLGYIQRSVIIHLSEGMAVKRHTDGKFWRDWADWKESVPREVIESLLSRKLISVADDGVVSLTDEGHKAMRKIEGRDE